MKKRPLTRGVWPSLLVWLLALHRATALDFTPIPSFRELEGVRIPVIQFNDETAKVNYRPPANWRLSGGGHTLHLYAPGNSQGWMNLSLVEKQRPRAGANGSVSPEELQATARQFLPPGAQEIALAKQVPNPFTLDGHATTEFIFTFSLYGSRNFASISLVDRSETEWIVMLVSSDARDFDALHEQIISSMFSWRQVQR